MKMSSGLSERIQRVASSATIAMSRAARELQESGADVIALSAGQPDFATPDHICEAAIAAMARGETGYTNVDGTTELKQAVSWAFARGGLDYAAEEINVSPGGKAVIANAFAATLSPGDEVIVPAPYWVSYPEMVKLYDASPVIVPGAPFKITPEALEAAITPRTRWLLLNSPGNPTGAVYSDAELKALGSILLRHPQVMILSDDIYAPIRFDVPFATMASSVPELKDRTLTMSGASKAFAMTGWRVGYAGGPGWLIEAMRKVMGQTTSCASSISQAACVAALDGQMGFLDEWLRAYRERRDMVVETLNAIPGISCDAPDGAFYVFAKLETDDDVAWCERLLHDAHVALVPGTAFGAPGHFRLSYAASMEDLREAMGRLARFQA